MTYKPKCEKCEKAYEAKRPHGKFCSSNCRVGSYNIQKGKEEKIKHFQDELKKTQNLLAEKKANMLGIETSLSEKEVSLQIILQKQQKVEKSKSMGFLGFYVKYQGKKEPVTKRTVPSSNMNHKTGL